MKQRITQTPLAYLGKGIRTVADYTLISLIMIPIWTIALPFIMIYYFFHCFDYDYDYFS